MKSIMPRPELLARFPDLQFTSQDRTGLRRLEVQDPSKMYELGITAWDRLCEEGLNPVPPFAIGPFTHPSNGSLPRWVEHTIGREVIYDFLWEQAKRPNGDQVSSVAVAHLYPGVLHLLDVEFSDVEIPIPEAERKYQYTKFAGLQLLPTLVDRLMTLGSELHVKRVTLTAAHRDLLPVFRRHGFEVSDTIAGRSNAELERSIPMDRRVV